MRSISIVRKGDEDDVCVSGKDIEKRVQSLFGNEFIELQGLRPSPKNILKGYFGTTTSRIYEMDGGAVIYAEHCFPFAKNINAYIGDIILIGFNEQSEVYQDLKSKLEEIASKNPEKVSKKIIDEKEKQNEIMREIEKIVEASKSGNLPYDASYVS